MSSSFERIRKNNVLLAFGYRHSSNVKKFTVFFRRPDVPTDADNFYALELSQAQYIKAYKANERDDTSSLDFRFKVMKAISSSDEAFEKYVLSGSEFCLSYICCYMTIDEVLLEGLFGAAENLKRNELE